jgi:biopolymer transport protein ExbB/TolQ
VNTVFLDAFPASEPAVTTQAPPSVFVLGDFWGLVQQAGPLRWPIFLVLGAGLILVFAKLYELVRDGAVSRPLFQVDLASCDLSRIVGEVSGQDESMLANLQSTMLNVFQTRPGEGMLHDEIHNFVSFQQDQFGVFRRRMEFLSDTAGALGLMGTVWGMFTVFFQGTSEQDVILRGMGIALITTLLGLVVSIILNFSSTELSTFFEKRLEQVSRKSDELRFRLMELAPAPALVGATPGGHPPAGVPLVGEADPDSVIAARSRPRGYRIAIGQPGRLVAAQAGAGPVSVGFELTTENGEPAPGVRVRASLSAGGGSLRDGLQETSVESGPDGCGVVEWHPPLQVGRHSLELVTESENGPPAAVDLAVTPGPPHQVEPSGGHQAAPAGARLAHPLVVRVTDAHGNPAVGVAVDFAAQSGGGHFPGREGALRQETSRDGLASIPFTLGAEPGPNVVSARVEGVADRVAFTLFGTAG